MDENSLHDGDHLFRVLRLMEKIIPSATTSALSVPELMLLILTVFFHDIGMAASKQDTIVWSSLWDNDLLKYTSSKQYMEFKKYCQSIPSILDEIDGLKSKGLLSKVELLKMHMISKYIRSTHAERTRTLIDEAFLSIAI